MKKYSKNIIMYGIILLLCLVFVSTFKDYFTNLGKTPEKYTYDKLISDLKEGSVASVEIERDSETSNAGTVTATFVEVESDSQEDSKDKQSVKIIDIDGFMSNHIDKAMAANSSLTVELLLPPKTGLLMNIIVPIIIVVIGMVMLFFVFQQMQGGNGNGRGVMGFGKNRARLVTEGKKKVTFADVAGLEEEKEDLKEIVEFLKAPKKFVEIGARIPKGVLLVGPPGTGKTYISRAVAGEANVPFFNISGSDFVEMFVGVGASRVRDLFEQAKKNTPCIVFIDEIDAVGRRRGAGLGGGHDEREQTLNQLLVEMDGFGVNEGVIILAATNRPDILDPALLRPGRFDRQVVVGRPDIKGREAVLKVHAKGKKLASDADLKVIAQTTSGFTPADLENLLNEAALLAARDDSKEISMADLRRAFVKIGIGTEKKSRVISEKERRITAYHEAGHAILFEVLPEMDPVHIVSIIPTGRAGGYTMPIPGDDKSYISKKYMEQDIIVSLGGRAAEFIVLDDITTGAQADIERATKSARSMVTKYGMSDVLGPILLGDDNEEVFIGRDLAHTRNYGENVASLIDSEIRRIVDESYQDALNLLRENIDILHKTADLLIANEKVTGDEFRSLFGKPPIQKDFMGSLNDGVIVAPPEKTNKSQEASIND